MSKLLAQITDRNFHSHGDFAAYRECVRWLESLGCSVGSMQIGAPTAVIFEPNARVSKYRNLGADIARVHGWISGAFIKGPVVFTLEDEGVRTIARAKAAA